jgi:DNA-binding response OmpR family regulator
MTTEPAPILIVEDDLAFGRILGFTLESAGFAVTLACDGSVGYSFARSQVFELIITNFDMPMMNGIDLCRLLRQDLRYETTPIILMTADKYKLDIPHVTYELDLEAIFIKPFSPRELVCSLKALLGRAANVINEAACVG